METTNEKNLPEEAFQTYINPSIIVWYLQDKWLPKLRPTIQPEKQDIKKMLLSYMVPKLYFYLIDGIRTLIFVTTNT